MKSGEIIKSGSSAPSNDKEFVTKKYVDENIISVKIDTSEYEKVDGTITLPTLDMFVTFLDGTTATYKVVSNV